MASIGPFEIVVIAGIALVVIGPEKFPGFAKVCMRTFRDLRGYLDEAKQEITKEIKPVQEELDEIKSYDPEDYLDALTGSEEEDASNQHGGISEEGSEEGSDESDPYGYNYGNDYDDEYSYGGADTVGEREAPDAAPEASEDAGESTSGEMTGEGECADAEDAQGEPAEEPPASGDEVPEGEDQDYEYPERLDG